MKWKLKRKKQCAKCPWRKDVDPHDIPDGYCEIKHANLKSTIAEPAAYNPLTELRAMACHETGDAHCIGWLHNQLGVGNNIALRMSMSSCENPRGIELVGEQHECFEDTLPTSKEDEGYEDM